MIGDVSHEPRSTLRVVPSASTDHSPLGLEPAPPPVIPQELSQDSAGFLDCPTRRRRLRLDGAGDAQESSLQEEREKSKRVMSQRPISERLATMMATAKRIMVETESDALLILA